MPAPILNLDDLDFVRWNTRFSDPHAPTERYGADVADIGRRIGARKMGYNVTVIDPGKAAYPAHNHRITEEMFLILDGAGELRLGEARHPVRAGDVIACPPGGPETAHQLRNTGETPLRVLCVSSFETADIIDYPDSGKTGFGVVITGPDGQPALKRGLARNADQPNYWDGE